MLQESTTSGSRCPDIAEAYGRFRSCIRATRPQPRSQDLATWHSYHPCRTGSENSHAPGRAQRLNIPGSARWAQKNAMPRSGDKRGITMRRGLGTSRYILWSFGSWRTSPTYRITWTSPRFFHQCDVPWVSARIWPALWTIGAAQLLAYSTISPC